MDPHDGIIQAVLGEGTRYEGKLFFDGRVRIDGDFQGEVQSDGLLVIGPTATVAGTVRVHTLIVRGGSIKGDIHATELVELHAPATVQGDIRTRALYLDKGVRFHGRCLMGEVLDLDASGRPSPAADDTSPDGYRDQPSKI